MSSKTSARASANNLLGVITVTNQIGIKQKAPPDNVKGEIEGPLQRAAHLDAQTISISVDNGRVTLDGTVSSLAERRIVEHAAWAAAGVSAVVDRLRYVE